MKRTCAYCQYRHNCPYNPVAYTDECSHFVEGKCFSCVYYAEGKEEGFCELYKWPGGCVNFKPAGEFEVVDDIAIPVKVVSRKEIRKDKRRARRRMRELKRAERIKNSEKLGYLYPYYVDNEGKLKKVNWKKLKSSARSATNRKIRRAKLEYYASRKKGLYRKAFDYDWSIY